MPFTCCCVPQCHERGGHTFPSDSEQRLRWIRAIKRLDEVTLKDWEPTPTAIVCKSHFKPDDYVQKNKAGVFQTFI